jgi:hypothetical protein
VAELADAGDLKSPDQNPQSSNQKEVTSIQNQGLPSCLPDGTQIDDRLAIVVVSWPELNEPIKAAVLAMIKAAVGEQRKGGERSRS